MNEFSKYIQGLNVGDFNVSGGEYEASRYGYCFQGGGGTVGNCTMSQNCFHQGGGGGGTVGNCTMSQNCFHQGGGGGGTVGNCTMSQNCFHQGGGGGTVGNCTMSQNCFQQGGGYPIGYCPAYGNPASCFQVPRPRCFRGFNQK
jgi:hypothetical protein